VRPQYGPTGKVRVRCGEAVSCVVAAGPCDTLQGIAAEPRRAGDHLESTVPRNCSVELSVRCRLEADIRTSLEGQIRIPGVLDSEHVEEAKGLDHDDLSNRRRSQCLAIEHLDWLPQSLVEHMLGTGHRESVSGPNRW
jgi:hypothetical protein